MERPKKILVVDDEAPMRRVIEMKLRSRGYEVITAMNGLDGLNLIRTERPDAVVSDINMPKMDGQTLCETTNPLKKERTFLTVILTARILPNEQEWLSRMQDTVFMEKPFSVTRLLAVIDGYFGGAP